MQKLILSVASKCFFHYLGARANKNVFRGNPQNLWRKHTIKFQKESWLLYAKTACNGKQNVLSAEKSVEVEQAYTPPGEKSLVVMEKNVVTASVCNKNYNTKGTTNPQVPMFQSLSKLHPRKWFVLGGLSHFRLSFWQSNIWQVLDIEVWLSAFNQNLSPKLQTSRPSTLFHLTLQTCLQFWIRLKEALPERMLDGYLSNFDRKKLPRLYTQLVLPMDISWIHWKWLLYICWRQDNFNIKKILHKNDSGCTWT